MAHLNMKVINKFGEFSGRVMLATNSTREEAVKVMQTFIGNVSTMKFLSLEDEEGNPTVFPAEVIKESVFKITVVE